MLVAKPAALRDLMQSIVNATHGLTDVVGEKQMISTIDERTLRAAALTALFIATGGVVWPGDEPLRIPAPKPAPGVLQVVG